MTVSVYDDDVEVQVKDVELVCTSLRPISIFDLAPAVLEGRAGFAEVVTAGKDLSLADRNSVAFAFKVGMYKLYKQSERNEDAKVSASDPNDLEPVREMLLLEESKQSKHVQASAEAMPSPSTWEAESGGARHLLPLLVQKAAPLSRLRLQKGPQAPQKNRHRRRAR